MNPTELREVELGSFNFLYYFKLIGNNISLHILFLMIFNK